MRLKFIFCVVLLFYTLQLIAQPDDIRFRQISPPGGYSFQAIHSFNQDKYGYMWMGGFDGVIRYNSKEITRFTHNAEDADGLPSNTITSIAIDNNNNIWVSTDKGLCFFNHSTQQFNRVKYTYENGSIANNKLFSIQLDGNGKLWIADEEFLGYLDRENNKMVRITNGLTSAPRLLFNDETNRLWLGTLNGAVFLVHPDKGNVEQKIEGLGSLVRTICTSFNKIWVGYQEHGARLYDLEGNLKTHYSYTENPEFDIKSTSIRKIWRDTRGQVWIGSYHGLFKFVGNQLTHFVHDKYEGLPHNSIFDIYEDRQGGLWIGTWSGGVAYLHHSDNKFTNYRHSKEPGAISDNMISSFAQTPDGELYVGTELFGLNKFHPRTGSFTPIEVRETKGVLDIKALEVDDKGGLWIASAFNGVYYRPKGNNKFIHFAAGQEDGNHVSAREVYSLCKSDSGMWIGTNLGGLNFYNFNTKRITFKSNKTPFSALTKQILRTMSIDNKNNLWITTLNGVYKFNLPSGISTHYNTTAEEKHKTSSQSFYFAKQLSDGKVWIGTGGNGINIYDNSTDVLSFFDANGLLADKDVYGIIEGRNNNVWITTNDGLILHNSKDNTSRRFVITDGIQGNLFNPNAIYKDRDDNLYFGGTNGFSLLEPKNINMNKRAPNILVNSIKANNRAIVPIQTGVNKFERIVLRPDETNLNFHFSADNFLLPEKNEYSYRLSNYIDEWVQAGNNGTATFMNIPAGEYVFEVKACNNDGIWNDNSAIIPVTIQQYWYKSNFAILFYSFAALLVAWLIIRFFRERSKLKKALLIEKIEHEQEEQMNEMKLKFFTNISHEFRTPLTLINGPVRQLLNADNLTEEQHKQLDTVKRNSNRLLQLINQIMDLRKLEKGMAKLNITKVELVDFTNERILSFSEEARSKNINLSFNYNKSSCIIEADEEKLDKIIFNLLSNAFKFTPANGNISIALHGNKTENVNYFSNQLSFGKLDKEDYIEIVVLDNGHGIDSQDLPNVFDRFERGKTKKDRNSTGIGLNLCKDFVLMHRGVIIVQSTPGEGTRFSVQLPTRQKAQKIMYQSHEKVRNIDSWEISTPIDTQLEEVTKGIRILVVEDNEDLREYIIQLLRNNYSVLSAANGKQGLEVLKKNNVELIVSDVMMPQMDGFEFCQTIKSQIETSHIPVILLTALSSSENTSTGLEKGADAYISKPFDENVLLSQVKNLLLQRKRLQENYAKKFITQQPIDIGSLDNYFLTKINTIIEENISNENFTVDLLATKLGLSRSQLHRKLKQISNHSTSEYITMVKIKKATVLLASKSYSIDEIAFKTGFNSHSYFTKCFKKIHGQSPKEYIKDVL